MERVNIVLEYTMHCSAKFLYKYISTSEGLSEWFADKVSREHNDFHFTFGDTVLNGVLLEDKPFSHVKFKLDDFEEGETLQMKLETDEITDELILIVQDYCDKGDEEEIQMLWEASILKLKSIVGA